MSLRGFLAGIICSFVTTQAMGWGNDGHSVIGIIADKELNPAAQSMLRDIIGLEPLAVTSIWADLVRDDSRFKKFDSYHFFEIPEGVKASEMPDIQLAETDAHTVIDQAPDKILSGTVSREEKIIWLRYLVHVIGDVHQPLHVGNGVDIGGNLCRVKWQRPGSERVEEIALHSLWDTRLLSAVSDDLGKNFPGGPRFLNEQELAELMVKELKSTYTMELANKSKPDKWYDDTRSLHRIVYPGDTKIKPEDRPYCRIVDPKTNKVVNGKFSENRIPLLQEPYTQEAILVIKKQLVLAGYRLAGTLNKIGAKYAPSVMGSGTERLELSNIFLRNKKSRDPQSEKGPIWRAQLPYPEDCH